MKKLLISLCFICMCFTLVGCDSSSGNNTTNGNFEKDDWATIAKNVKSGNYNYKVGDTKQIDMGEFGVHTLRVANTSECKNGETSQTACGFVLEFTDFVTKKRFNSTDSNLGGWENSELRSYINSTIYNSLPSDLKNAIIDTKVVSGHGKNADESNFVTTDKLYLLSVHEVWDCENYATVKNFDTSYENTRQLDYYAKLNVDLKNDYSGAIKEDAWWWLRSAHSNYPNRSLIVYGNGYVNWILPDSKDVGISPAFRIGK